MGSCLPFSFIPTFSPKKYYKNVPCSVSDWDIQLKSKDAIPMQNVPEEKNSNHIKMVRLIRSDS